MSLRSKASVALVVCLLGGVPLAAAARGAGQAQVAPSGQTVRIVGTVRDETNAIALPGVPVEVVGTTQVVYTDVDGRYVLQVAPGKHEVKIALDGYQEKTINVDATERTNTLNVGLMMATFSELVEVQGTATDLETSSAEAQLAERRQAPVITDNMGAQEMRRNGDSDAAAAMSRVTGVSVVEGQYVFVRGLGERYSNTTLAGSVLPTTEPDKKVVPLDLFPAGLIDSVQVNKSYSPDKSAEFAGGLVQIIPMKLPSQPVMDFTYGFNYYTNATGDSIPLSPLGNRDVWGYDSGARALPSAFPANKIVRRGIYTPDVGYPQTEMDAYGRSLENRWLPASEDAKLGQNWGMTFGNRFGDLGVVASVTHQYKEQYVAEERRFYRVADQQTGELESISDYQMQTGTQRAQLGIVGNLSYQFNPNQRLSFENFYTHSGRDEGRYFEGPNNENNFWFRNNRLQFIEEGLFSNAVGGEHFFQNLRSSRVDWRVNYARATRDEPDLRETLYQGPIGGQGSGTFLLADESQSGFRMFNELGDDTLDVAVNWSLFNTAGARPTQWKFGMSYVDRSREFQSRRFRFIPNVLNKDSAVPVNLALPPEQLYTSDNVGTAFRFNEETRPTDAYTGDLSTVSGYGMVDISMSSTTRLIAGLRVEGFDQTVVTQDPFGLFQRQVTTENENTDLFPGINFVQALTPTTNLRLSYSTTVNRPEFRELAEFEFTDVVGNRAVKGNPELQRALIQNVDARWERFTGGRGVLAASFFYKYFDKPIERVVIAAANPIATFQNADNARNFGIEIEAGREFGEHFFLNANYTWVDSEITLLEDQRTVQTSQVRPLAGQSETLFNVTGEALFGGFSTRVLFNYFGDRISDVGANQAPDIIEQGRPSLDVVFGQRLGKLAVRLTLENLTDSDYEYTQTGALDPQRLYVLGRTVALSFGFNAF